MDGIGWFPQAASGGLTPSTRHTTLGFVQLPPAVRTLLNEQHQVISRTQCLERGMTVGQLRTLLDTARWQRLHRAVYAASSGLISDDATLRAALLAVPGGMVCNESSLWLGRRRGPLPQPVNVAVSPAGAPRNQKGIRLHRLERLVATGSDPPRMSHERAVLEVVNGCATARAVESQVCQVVGDGLTVPRRIVAELALRPRQRWRGLLVPMLDEVAVGARSPLELADLRNDRRHALPVGERQVHQKQGGQGRWLDVVVSVSERPDLIVIKELDGRLGHEKTGRFRDMGRDNAAALSGGRSLRLGWGDTVGDPCGTAALQVLLWLRLGVTVGAACGRPGCDLEARVSRLGEIHPWLAATS